MNNTAIRCTNHHSAASGFNQQKVDKMNQEAVRKDDEMHLVEQMVLQGDLSKLSPDHRVMYYKKVCESAGLNPFTRPFDYIILNGKLTLYAKKDCTEQLRKIHGVSVEGLDDKVIDDLYIVKAKVKDKSGRTDESTGAVSIGGLKGEAKANAIMKAETKAKRRATLSICGMGWTDESEIESIPNVKKVEVDMSTGEIQQEFLPEEKPIISEKEAEELDMILGDCDPKYREWVMECLNKQFKVNSVKSIPKDIYQRVLKAALINLESYRSIQMQKASDLVLEEVAQ